MASEQAEVLMILSGEYANRREKALRSLNGCVGVVMAGEPTPTLTGKWRADANFLYLTGIEDEAGAVVLFDPSAEDPKQRIVLFLKPVDPDMERWDGYRERINSALKERTRFTKIMRSNYLPRSLTAAVRRCRRVACLHPFAVYPAPVSPDLALFRQVIERIPNVAVEDRTNLLPEMRVIKSPAELALIQRAIAATAAGFAAALKMIRPGVNEADVQEALERGYRDNGGTGLAYNSIVGSGLNGTVLHYIANKAPLEPGDLMVIDSAASCGGYAADVTRTFPVSGRFTAEQREVYDVVLRAQAAAIRAARPGAKASDVDAAARRVIEKAGYGDAFIHGIGHPIGLDVHDATPDGPLKAGTVMTIEPGIYLPDRKMGIRIEDDILITRSGSRELSGAVPKDPDEIEEAMR